MSPYSFQKVASVRDCCKNDENLDESRDGDLTVLTCKICSRRHRILKVHPGLLGMIPTQKNGGKIGRIKRALRKIFKGKRGAISQNQAAQS